MPLRTYVGLSLGPDRNKNHNVFIAVEAEFLADTNAPMKEVGIINDTHENYMFQIQIVVCNLAS